MFYEYPIRYDIPTLLNTVYNKNDPYIIYSKQHNGLIVGYFLNSVMIKIRLHFSTMFAQILPMLVVTLLLGLSTIYVFSKQNILPHSTEQIHRNEIINHAEFVEFPHGTVVRAPFKPHRLCISQPTRLGPILISILKNIQYIDHIQGTQKPICT